MSDSLPNRCRRVLSLIDRPLMSTRTDRALNHVALAVTYVAAAMGLWYFWIVRPLWVSVALSLLYAGVSAYLVRRAVAHRAGRS